MSSGSLQKWGSMSSRRGNALVSVVALVVACASLLVSVAAYRKAGEPDPNALRLAKSVDALARAVERM